MLGIAAPQFRSDKVRALLAYLAVEIDHPHPRSLLATLFWPDMRDQLARRNLSQTLSRLRQAIRDQEAEPPLLLITPQDVRLNPACAVSCDVWQFEAFLAGATPSELEQALALYQGTFLAGFSLPDSNAFEEWATVRREDLHRQALEICARLAEYYEQQHDYASALRCIRRQLELEPWREEAHRHLMRVLALDGQRSAALAHFEVSRQILQRELRVTPDIQTLALYEQIRRGELTSLRNPQPVQPEVFAPALLQQPGPAFPPPTCSAQLADWGDAPRNNPFYGRHAEVDLLARQLVLEGCRVVAVIGVGGVGKTTLVAHGAGLLAGQFSLIFWRSLLNATPFYDFMRSCLQFLSGQALGELPKSLDAQLDLLLWYLREQRCLLVLDNFESILQSDHAGHFLPGYEGYQLLLQRLAAQEHQSCLVLTSRELPLGLERLIDENPRVRALRLGGVDEQAGQAILHKGGLPADRITSEQIVSRYSGNALALRLVARTIKDIFDGDVIAFLREETPIFDDIRAMLDQQFGRISQLERDILIWLAIEREPVSFATLIANLVNTPSRSTLIEALRSLQRRSLLEKFDDGFRLQNVLIEYLTDALIDRVCREVEHATAPDLPYLSSFALLKASAKTYVRQSQSRRIVEPIIGRLADRFGRHGSVQRINALLARLHIAPPTPSYAAGNLLNLLVALDADLRGYDFSGLTIRQAYLADTRLHDVSFAGAELRDCALRDSFGFVFALALSPDPDQPYLAAGTDNGEIQIWQLGDTQLTARIQASSQTIRCLAFSPDGSLLASGGDDQIIRIWQIASQRQVALLHGHSNLLASLAFSPGGSLLASASADGTIRLWDVAAGSTLAELCHYQGPVAAVAFSPDGSLLASGGADRTVYLWAVDQILRDPHPTPQSRLDSLSGGVRCLSFSPDGYTLAVGGNAQQIQLWDVAGQQLDTILCGHTDIVMVVTFSPDGSLLASGSVDHSVRLWDARTGQAYRILQEHSDGIRGIAFSHNSRLIVSGSTDRSVRTWDVDSGMAIAIQQGVRQANTSVAFSPDGQLLASGSYDHDVRIWDLSRGQLLHAYGQHSNSVYAVAFCGGGNLVASASADQTVALYDLRSARTQAVLRAHADEITALAVAPVGPLLASGGFDQQIVVWDSRGGQVLQILRAHLSWINGLAFGPDGRLLASIGFDQTLRLWDAAAGQLLHTWATDEQWAVAFSPDGRFIASGGRDRLVSIWDVERRQLHNTFAGHHDMIHALAFSPDGRLLASAGYDRTIRLWDVSSATCLRIYTGHNHWIWSLAFSPDGNTLASASADETIRLWDMASDECFQILQTPRPYAGLNISDTAGLSDAQRQTLKALGAVEHVPTRPTLDDETTALPAFDIAVVS